MNLALIGATGNVGAPILDELLQRGHTVTAIVRRPEKVLSAPGVVARQGDVLDQEGLAPLLAGHDAVISAVPFAVSDPVRLIDAVRASGVRRYLVVGGAGSLEVAPGVQLLDSPDFPAQYKEEATAGAAFLDRLRGEAEIDWTFLSPSAMFVPGERTGHFRLGRDALLTHAQGSSISYQDYAIALVDEVERPAHSRQRFTVGY
ncbi:3-beta hydroxysteroid dehydrogenase [Aureimonas sp. SA4125]|nr:3-beta hydroxysteroid dehydrogenase [Aureimonas sp. SA4125]